MGGSLQIDLRNPEEWSKDDKAAHTSWKEAISSERIFQRLDDGKSVRWETVERSSAPEASIQLHRISVLDRNRFQKHLIYNKMDVFTIMKVKLLGTYPALVCCPFLHCLIAPLVGVNARELLSTRAMHTCNGIAIQILLPHNLIHPRTTDMHFSRSFCSHLDHQHCQPTICTAGAQVAWFKCFDSHSLYNTIIGKVNERGLDGMYEVLLDTAAPEFGAALNVILEVFPTSHSPKILL